MAQINLYQYAELVRSDGSVVPVGSKTKASTISLTGTGEVLHIVKNDLASLSTTVVYNGELTGIKWIAMRSSVDATVAFGTDATATSATQLKANVWQFFNSGMTTNSSSTTIATRVAAATVAIADISVYIAGGATGDVEVLIAY